MIAIILYKAKMIWSNVAIILSSEILEIFGDTSQECILFHKNYMYAHKIIHFNYTIYDMQWDQDTVNPWTSHYNMMFLFVRLCSGSVPHKRDL